MRSDVRPLAQWMENVSVASTTNYYWWETDADGWTIPVAFGNMAVLDSAGFVQVDVASLPAGATELDTVIRGTDGPIRLTLAV